MFISSMIKDILLVVHLDVYFEGVVEVLGVDIMTRKIFLLLDFVYGWWHAKFH